MFFSIIVPVYNTAKYLYNCIESILEQSFCDYELILVDDGSNDGSGEICDRYAEKKACIRVIHKENGGPASARNAGINEANGEWVLFVDSDDYLAKDALKVLANEVKRNPADVYTYNYLKVDDKEKILSKEADYIENRYEQFVTESQNVDYIYDKVLKYKVGWEVWRQLFNRDIIEKIGLRFSDNAKSFAEDLLFSIQYYTSIKRVYYICNFLYNYRQTDSSLMHTMKEEQVLPKLFCLGEEFYRFCKKNKKKEHLKRFYNIYFSLLDFHIQYKLDNTQNDKIALIISSNRNALHNKMMKKILNNKDNFKYCNNKRDWLRYGIRTR